MRRLFTDNRLLSNQGSVDSLIVCCVILSPSRAYSVLCFHVCTYCSISVIQPEYKDHEWKTKFKHTNGFECWPSTHNRCGRHKGMQFSHFFSYDTSRLVRKLLNSNFFFSPAAYQHTSIQSPPDCLLCFCTSLRLLLQPAWTFAFSPRANLKMFKFAPGYRWIRHD